MTENHQNNFTLPPPIFLSGWVGGGRRGMLSTGALLVSWVLTDHRCTMKNESNCCFPTCCYFSVLCEYQPAECPTVFKDNELNRVKCTFDMSSGNCNDTVVVINVDRPGKLRGDRVECRSEPWPCVAPSGEPSNHEECACTAVNGSLVTYTLAYKVNRTRDGGARVVCQRRSASTSCDNIITFRKLVRPVASSATQKLTFTPPAATTFCLPLLV
jgi:hypothetical protein